MAYKRVLINLPEELLAAVDQAAKIEHRMRSEFVREALRDRVSRAAFAHALQVVRSQAKNDHSEAEIESDIAEALRDARSSGTAGGAG